MIFTTTKFKQAMDALLAYAETLLPLAIESEIESQRRDYENNVKRIMNSSGANRDETVALVGEFAPDKDAAETMAKVTINVAIGNRVRGAIACYEVGNEAECARLLVFVQATLFDIIGLRDAAQALNDATGYMHKMQQQNRQAA